MASAAAWGGPELCREPDPPGKLRVTDAGSGSRLEGLGVLARVAAGAWLRTATWGLGASIRAARAATDPRQALELAQEVGEGVRGYAREFLGVSDLDRRIGQLMPGAGAGEQSSNGQAPEGDSLRAAGAELLRQSTEVDSPDTIHPAFARILEELAPDEARILRLMAGDGPGRMRLEALIESLGLPRHIAAYGIGEPELRNAAGGPAVNYPAEDLLEIYLAAVAIFIALGWISRLLRDASGVVVDAGMLIAAGIIAILLMRLIGGPNPSSTGSK